MSRIDRVQIREFSFDVPDIGLEQAAAGIGNMAYVKGATLTARRFAVRILQRRRRLRRVCHALGGHAGVPGAGGDAGAIAARARPGPA